MKKKKKMASFNYNTLQALFILSKGIHRYDLTFMDMNICFQIRKNILFLVALPIFSYCHPNRKGGGAFHVSLSHWHNIMANKKVHIIKGNQHQHRSVRLCNIQSSSSNSDVHLARFVDSESQK